MLVKRTPSDLRTPMGKWQWQWQCQWQWQLASLGLTFRPHDLYIFRRHVMNDANRVNDATLGIDVNDANLVI